MTRPASTPMLPHAILGVALPSVSPDAGKLAEYRAVADDQFEWARTVEITDATTLAQAIQRLADTREAERRIEAARLDLVRPGNGWVTQVNAIVNWVSAPLILAVETLNRKIASYRAAERQRAQEETRRRQEEAERARREAARQAAAAAEAAASARRSVVERDTATTLGDFLERTDEAARAETVAADARMSADTAAQTAREATAEALTALRDPAAAKTVTLADGTQATLRAEWTHRVVDLAQVPREYLMLDERAVKAKIREVTRRSDVTEAQVAHLIPGLEIYQDESSIAIRRRA